MSKKKKPTKKPKEPADEVRIVADEPAELVVEGEVDTSTDVKVTNEEPIPASEAAGLPPPEPDPAPPTGWPAAGSYASPAGGPSPADAAPPPALRQGSIGCPSPEPAAPAPGSAPPPAPHPRAPTPLTALATRAGRTGRVEVSGARAEAVRLAASECLGRPLDAAPVELDGRGLPPGLSAELAERLAARPPTLGTLVLASREQRGMALADPLHSFEEALRDEIFRRAAATLDLLLERTVVVARIHARPSPAVPEDLLAVEEVYAALDTAGGHLATIARFEEELAPLARDPEALLDEERVDRLVARAQELSAALGDLAGAGLTGPLEVPLAAGSFWTAWGGGVYRLASRPALLVHNPQRTPLTGADLSGEAVRLTDPGLIDRLHASGFLTFDHELVEPRTRELEDEALLAGGADPAALDDPERRRTVASRARAMPRTWHEMAVVRRALAGGPSGARVIHTLSAETKVKLSRPLKDVAVVSRLLAELDAIDYLRLFTYFPERFERDYLAASPLKQQHMVRVVEASFEPAPRPPPAAPPEPEPAADEDEDDITFL